jgi:hypothetical protein
MISKMLVPSLYSKPKILTPRQWIPVYLTPKFGLNDSEKEKACLFVDDLLVLLNNHWVHDTEVFAHERLRIQMALLLVIGGCTATRPSALVGKRPLLYEDIELVLVRNPVKGSPSLGMKVNLKNIKRSGGKSREQVS